MASGKKGCCLFSLLKFFFLVLIVLVIVSIVLFLYATGAPTSYPAPVFEGRDTGVVANIVTRLARSLVDKEGRVVDTAVLKLSQSEVQTLLDAAIAKSNDLKHETVPYAVIWEDGKLHLHYSSIVSDGCAVNFSVEVSPVVEQGELTLVPGGGSAGQLPLPYILLNYAAKKLARKAMKNDSTRTALSAFTRIEPGDDGTLLLMFDPRDVNTVIRILRSAGESPEEERVADGDDADDSADSEDEDAEVDSEDNRDGSSDEDLSRNDESDSEENEKIEE